MIHFSIAIATFNSEKTLKKVLHAIRSQKYNQKNIEICIMDGGSTDKTLLIAKKFDCRIIKNPRTEPVYAKFLAYTKAKGKYLIYLDHDEVLLRDDTLLLREKIFHENPSVKAIINSGYKSPPNYSFINTYINEFGDPFSFFIYRISKDYRFFIFDMKRKYSYRQEKDYSIFSFSATDTKPLIELCAASGTIDSEYFKANFPQTIKNPSCIPHFFYLLMKKKGEIAITENDPILHYSAEHIGKYLNKIKWRVKNNIYHKDTMGEAGFSGRLQYHSSFDKIKKYFYPVYVFSLILPLLDALSLILSRREVNYIMHVPLTLYTGSLIVYNYVLKYIGFSPALKSYDEKKTIAKADSK